MSDESKKERERESENRPVGTTMGSGYGPLAKQRSSDDDDDDACYYYYTWQMVNNMNEWLDEILDIPNREQCELLHDILDCVFVSCLRFLVVRTHASLGCSCPNVSTSLSLSPIRYPTPHSPNICK